MIKKTGCWVFMLSAALVLPFPVQAAQYNGSGASSLSSLFSSGDEVVDSEKEKTSGRDGEKDSQSGPGVNKDGMDVDGQTGDTGPKIHEVTLDENYHEDYQLYELSLNGQYFLYSNVSNGGITDQPVYVDIPQGILFKMEKDGVVFPYASRQKVGDTGTYVLRLTAVRDADTPLSEQEEYRSVFRFRIEPKPPETEEGLPGRAGEALSNATGGLFGGDGSNGKTAGGGDAQNEAGMEEERLEEEKVSGPQKEDSGQEETAGEENPAVKQEEKAEGEKAAKAGKTEKRTQIYDEEDAVYQVILENGFTFSSNVPEGMIWDQPVKLVFDSPVEECQLYLQGEPVEYESGEEIAAAGTYLLKSGEYEFGFEITNGYLNRESYPVPKGMIITEARLEGERLELEDESLLGLETDGVYAVTLTGEAGERYVVGFVKDSVPPKVTVTVGKQQATVEYGSDDIRQISLSKNGKAPQLFNGDVITGPGKYVLTVSDQAGNVTQEEFALKFHMNIYSVLAIVLGIAVVAGGVFAIIRMKKNLTVR